MVLTGVLRQVSIKKCPQCGKEYGNHSKKGFMRCLYVSNYNLYNVMVELQTLKQPINEVQNAS